MSFQEIIVQLKNFVRQLVYAGTRRESANFVAVMMVSAWATTAVQTIIVAVTISDCVQFGSNSVCETTDTSGRCHAPLLMRKPCQQNLECLSRVCTGEIDYCADGRVSSIFVCMKNEK